MADDLFETGIQIREEMFGPAGARAKVEAADDFNRPFEDLVTTYCFGATWSRPGLDRKSRSMVTLAMLIALGREPEIRVHTAGALANGVTKQEIQEICLQAAIYAGVPAAGGGFRGASEVFAAQENA
jgi:4-carboxymuconolactone decarboxylase